MDLERAAKAEQIYEESSEDMLFGRPKDEVVGDIVAVFQGYDADGNGHLDPGEFRKCLNETQILGRPLDPKEVQSIMVGIDENEDGRIDYEEFINFMLEIMEYYYREQRMSEM